MPKRGQAKVPEKPLRIVFAPMDCKNQRAVSTDYPYMPYRGRNTNEERILRDAELEYLLAILDLRIKIREQYTPLLEKLDPMSGSRHADEVRRVYNEHYEAHRGEWDKVRRLYYT